MGQFLDGGEGGEVDFDIGLLIFGGDAGDDLLIFDFVDENAVDDTSGETGGDFAEEVAAKSFLRDNGDQDLFQEVGVDITNA